MQKIFCIILNYILEILLKFKESAISKRQNKQISFADVLLKKQYMKHSAFSLESKLNLC